MRSVWWVLAGTLFFVATADRYAAVFEAGVDVAVPSRVESLAQRPLLRTDQEFVVWAVARNAHTLITQPSRLFDAEQCFPEKRSLALGEPVIAMGLLAIPGWILSGDPVVTYNLLMFAMSMCAALAMFWLVAEWTGSHPAGIVAGLLYAFHGLGVQGVVHPYSSDTTWMVLALGFAKRLFERGRWGDALALTAAAAMQIATSFYSFVAAGLIGLPFVVWLFYRHRLAAAKPLQLGLVAAGLLVAGAAVFGPYVDQQAAGVLADRAGQNFRPWSEYGPGRRAFFGWLPWLLVVVGLILPRGTTLPRIAMVVGGLLVAAVAAGPGGLFGLDLYAELASVAPGFDSVRIPWKIGIGTHLVLCVLAGIGVAGLLGQVTERTSAIVKVAAVAIAFGWIALWPGRPDPPALTLRPSEASTSFYEDFADQGNDGPIFEDPSPGSNPRVTWNSTARQLLLSAWHHRPTSACYPSHPPRSRARLEHIASRTPSGRTIRELQRLGFTTIVVRHLPTRQEKRIQPARTARGLAYQRLAARTNAPIRTVHETRWATAYELTPRPPSPRSGAR